MNTVADAATANPAFAPVPAYDLTRQDRANQRFAVNTVNGLIEAEARQIRAFINAFVSRIATIKNSTPEQILQAILANSSVRPTSERIDHYAADYPALAAGWRARRQRVIDEAKRELHQALLPFKTAETFRYTKWC